MSEQLKNSAIENLEKKSWYRLLKVIYIFCFILLIIITAIWAMLIKPSHDLLLDSSGFQCPNKVNFLWKELHGSYYYPGNSYLDMRDHFSAIYNCELINIVTAQVLRHPSESWDPVIPERHR